MPYMPSVFAATTNEPMNERRMETHTHDIDGDTLFVFVASYVS